MMLTKKFGITISLKTNIILNLIISITCFSIAFVMNSYNSQIIEYQTRYDDIC